MASHRDALQFYVLLKLWHRDEPPFMSFLTELTGDGLHCKRVAPDDTLAISASAVRQSQLLSSRLLKNGPHCRWRVRLSQRERMGEEPSTSHCARERFLLPWGEG